ncbi:hypothetical protein PF005_g27539 [Phytophthora fragariae]|uniref:Uncharacterized protein n=2 Tax=Phytophthora TaxID=4783 RepID=A0A6A3HP80_9STRA|nr:hypothetical protein PF003_g787 [Phytophthora fragariae]KAE8973722.1 hypothetical protein PR001_g26225 [Phytophthora rubi]KAE8921380.1 hypothetical protein PF009_g28343 [Phytophthora fragariae]KAE8970505.1 hypothetical protein PF011_g26387 [Phytophthora fragariae]KAE9039522.1 hypothetical protein PR002_g5470 [Phytophthora rubi]
MLVVVPGGGDKLEECNVLALIDDVTDENPFTSLTIRWRVTENPPVMRTFFKSYDHIYLEATGFTTLSNGDRVSYQLLHSIDFPHLTPPLSTLLDQGPRVSILHDESHQVRHDRYNAL